MFQMKV